ncbi:asparagine synthase-related protein [Dyadobacter sp. CY356]|uniref:asparagine synthase-related protein n=1 Tax=Dyadobacter sp. CY356 TaxID=2906442 RepID=UPI001F458092|nr:asparagine synthase-related protein [Dyadobacter sp. CY356]MCF0058373.1 asparagine synthase-related protein [Dyadobacter sp. CY356]
MISIFFSYDNIVSNLEYNKSNLHISFSKGYVLSEDCKNLENRFFFESLLDINEVKCQNETVSKEIFSFDTVFALRRFQKQIASENRLIQSLYYNSDDDTIKINRDLFGLIPLYYIHIPFKFFALSTELTFLLNIPEVRSYSDIDITRISSYLKWMNDGSPYNKNTFYANIKSVLPGHVLEVSKESVNSTPYVDFNPGKWNHLKTVDDYGIAFRDLFEKSVGTLLRNKSIIGSHLSGGLDSSSVSCMCRVSAPNKVIHTFYADTSTESTNEGHLALEAAVSISARHHVVIPSNHDLETIIKHTALCGFPEQMVIGSALQSSLMTEAQMFGCDILMTGSDGDSIVGHGFEYLQQLTDNRNWIALLEGLQDMATNRKPVDAGKDWAILDMDKKKQFVYIDYFYKQLAQSLHERSLLKSLSLISSASKYFNVSPGSILRKVAHSLKNSIAHSTRLPTSISRKSVQHLNFAQESLLQAPQSLIRNLSSGYLSSFEDVFYNQAIAINEERYYLGNHYGINLGYPFYDKDLFELNLAIPLKIKFDNARGRGQLRNAMNGVLPENIRLRTDKGIFGIYARQAAIRLYVEGRDFLTDSSQVWDYVDKSLFQQAVKLLMTENQPRYIYNRMLFFVNRTMNLTIWLHFYNQKRF